MNALIDSHVGDIEALLGHERYELVWRHERMEHRWKRRVPWLASIAIAVDMSIEPDVKPSRRVVREHARERMRVRCADEDQAACTNRSGASLRNSLWVHGLAA